MIWLRHLRSLDRKGAAEYIVDSPVPDEGRNKRRYIKVQQFLTGRTGYHILSSIAYDVLRQISLVHAFGTFVFMWHQQTTLLDRYFFQRNWKFRVRTNPSLADTISSGGRHARFSAI